MATIIGRGLIATELKKRNLPEGVYYFSGVSSNALLNEDFDLKIIKQINEFINILIRCRNERKYFVYASSSVVATPNTAYSKLKVILEKLVEFYDIPNLGIRLPLIYGPNESHKGNGASIIYQWCQSMKKGEQPVIFGDGTQTRDFMFIDDAIDNIVRLAEKHTVGIVSFGTGIKTSFNEIVRIINKVLGANIKSVYVNKPDQYIQEIKCELAPFKVSLEEGIRKIYEKNS